MFGNSVTSKIFKMWKKFQKPVGINAKIEYKSLYYIHCNL